MSKICLTIQVKNFGVLFPNESDFIFLGKYFPVETLFRPDYLLPFPGYC